MMQITLSSQFNIEDYLYSEVNVVEYSIRYAENCVTAVGGDANGITFSCTIINDLTGVDLSEAAFTTLFKAHIEANYPEQTDD
jgi:hypothetical protein